MAFANFQFEIHLYIEGCVELLHLGLCMRVTIVRDWDLGESIEKKEKHNGFSKVKEGRAQRCYGGSSHLRIK